LKRSNQLLVIGRMKGGGFIAFRKLRGKTGPKIVTVHDDMNKRIKRSREIRGTTGNITDNGPPN
jgi:hypothetical protein